jgi:hypothetical protein
VKAYDQVPFQKLIQFYASRQKDLDFTAKFVM